MATKMLRVWANPYAALDHRGRAAGACPTDPKHILGEWVGATRKEVDGETTFAFSDEEIAVPDSQYYRERVRTSELIAADEKTAKLCGVQFVARDEALKAQYDEALVEWSRMYLDADPPEVEVPKVSPAQDPAPLPSEPAPAPMPAPAAPTPATPSTPTDTFILPVADESGAPGEV